MYSLGRLGMSDKSIGIVQVFDSMTGGALSNIFGDSVLSNLFNQTNRQVPNSQGLLGYELGQVLIDHYYANYRILQKVVESKPNDSIKKLPEVKDASKTINQEELLAEFSAIPAIGEPMEEIDSQQAVGKGGIYGNLYGDGFLFLGINDGLEPDQPVDLSKIKGISWIIVRHRYEVGIDYQKQGYRLITNPAESTKLGGEVFHYTRVVRIPGIKLHGQALRNNGGYNDSVLHAVYREWERYNETIASASRMINTHSLFKFKMEGLASMLMRGEKEKLKKRFEGIMSSLDVFGGLVYDASNEEAEFMNRTYAGADKLIDLVIQWFVAAADMPVSKIFGTPGSKALSESGKAEQQLWNESVNQYQTSRTSLAHFKIFRYLLAAKNNYNPFLLGYPEHYPLPALDRAEERRRHAIADKIYIMDLKLDPAMVLNSSKGVDFDG